MAKLWWWEFRVASNARFHLLFLGDADDVLMEGAYLRLKDIEYSLTTISIL